MNLLIVVFAALLNLVFAQDSDDRQGGRRWNHQHDFLQRVAQAIALPSVTVTVTASNGAPNGQVATDTAVPTPVVLALTDDSGRPITTQTAVFGPNSQLINLGSNSLPIAPSVTISSNKPASSTLTAVLSNAIDSSGVKTVGFNAVLAALTSLLLGILDV